MECHYKLLSFGIPEELMLSDHEGNLRQEYVDFWIQKQKDFEQKRILQQQHLHQQQQLVHPGAAPSANVSPAVVEGHGTSASLAIISNNNGNRDIDEITPTDKDILLGRKERRRPGNARLTQLVEEYYEAYQAASMIDKTMLSWKIVRIITDDEGRRFLERDSTSTGDAKWKVVSDETARYKVAYGFRTHSKLVRRRKMKMNVVK